jgi:hypothetical protein
MVKKQKKKKLLSAVLGLAIFALAIPLTTNLVQQNQEIRSNAAGSEKCVNGRTKCDNNGAGDYMTCKNGKWVKEKEACFYSCVDKKVSGKNYTEATCVNGVGETNIAVDLGAGIGAEACLKLNSNARCVASMKSKSNDACSVNGKKGIVVVNKCAKQYNTSARCCVPDGCIEGRKKCDGIDNIMECKGGVWIDLPDVCPGYCSEANVSGQKYTTAKCVDTKRSGSKCKKGYECESGECVKNICKKLPNIEPF